MSLQNSTASPPQLHMQNGHTNPTDYLGRTVEVVIDRPLGTTHPTHGFTYPCNYGYVPGTVAPDGEELDAYVLELDAPRETFIGTCVAVIHRTDDQDDKLIIVPAGVALTDAAIRSATHFQEQWFTSVIVRPAGGTHASA